MNSLTLASIDAVPILPGPSRADRNVPLASKGRFTGHIVAGPGAGRIIQTESHLEFDWCLCLLARPETAELREQVAFEWHGSDGVVHLHFFDFLVVQIDRRSIAYTVKPKKRTSQKFLEEMQLVTDQAVSQGFVDDVRLLSEEDLDPVAVFNARLFHGMRASDAEADAMARDVVARMSGTTSLLELTNLIEIGPRGFRALIRLMAKHVLVPVRRGRISPQTEVFKRKDAP